MHFKSFLKSGAWASLAFALMLVSCGEEAEVVGTLDLTYARVDGVDLLTGNAVVPEGSSEIELGFDKTVNESSFAQFSMVEKQSGETLSWTPTWTTGRNEVNINLASPLQFGKTYELHFPNAILSSEGDTLRNRTLSLMVSNDPLQLDSLLLNGKAISDLVRTEMTGTQLELDLYLSHEVPLDILQRNISLSRTGAQSALDFTRVGERHFKIKPQQEVDGFREYRFRLLEGIGTEYGKVFSPREYLIFTNFQALDDEALLTLVQKQTFGYFWDFGHPVSGLARERNTSGDVVTTGGSGFGLMAMIVGVERGFITRDQALERWEIMVSFLRNADRFHGVWAHWMNGASGKVYPFSPQDNGGDLVETSFMIQALYTLRQYLSPGISREANLIGRINGLIDAVEWDWYTRGGQNVLYWHWSPDFAWAINLPMRGYNETLIAYVLAASSTTHSISAEVYRQGYARNGGIKNGNTYYGYKLPLGSGRGGPLFFTHYSFLGLDPRKLKDTYADYWEQNVNHSLINRAYCISNPLKYSGYGEKNWGLTASDGNNGYNAFSPDNDRGVIAPTAALSSMPYTPAESMTALRNYYYTKGDRLWGPYGFYDAFNDSAGWTANSYLAIDQGPIICMIENHRSALLWNLFMSAPEIKAGLSKLGFTYE